MNHKILRNSDGSAYVVDHKGKHVATHDTYQEAKDHVDELREELESHEKWDNKEHSKIAGELSKHIKQDETAHKKLEDRISHDPYYDKKK